MSIVYWAELEHELPEASTVYWTELENRVQHSQVYWAELETTADTGSGAFGSADLPSIETLTLVGAGSVLVGATLGLLITVEDQDGDPIANLSPAVSSSDGAVATVALVAATDANGEATATVTAVAGVSAVITATVDGKSSSLPVYPENYPDDGDPPIQVIQVTTVTLSVPTISLEIGTTGSASVTVRDQNAAAVSGVTVTWASSSGAVIASPAATTTSATGTTTVSLPALTAGTTTISATCAGVASSGIVVTVFAVAEPPTYSGEGSAQIVVTAESRLAGWERPKIRRFNDADQKKLHPTDRFFEGMAESGESEIVWPSAALLRRLG